MIVQDNPTVSVSHGMGKTVEYTANMDGMMFDNMINGIYSNKIAAPIREISTNARDGHALNNCLDKPFDVALPTRLDPTFSVRDYGCSLTEDEVMNIYSVIGMSTKRDSNQATGCLGLGSKSPFAYTSAFSITCWKDGFEELYTSYKQTGGTPVIAKVHRVLSNKPQGVMVSFAVKVEDVDAFNKEASKVFIGFNPRPNVTRHSQVFQWDDRQPVIKTDKVEIFSKRSASYNDGVSYAISGSVAYPLKLDPALVTAINNHPDTEKAMHYPYKTKEELLLQKADLRVYFDIGQLTTTTSREELSYDAVTCKNIANRLVEIIKEQEATFNLRYDKEPNLFAAQKKLYEDVESNVVSVIADIIQAGTNVEYKGKSLWYNARIENTQYDCYAKFSESKRFSAGAERSPKVFGFQFINLALLTNKYAFGELKPSFSFTKASQSGVSINFNQFQEAKFFIVERKDKLRINNRYRRMWKDLDSTNRNYLLIVDKWSDWEKFRKFCMIPKENITFLKDVEELPLEKEKTKTPNGQLVVSTIVDLRELKPSRYSYNSNNYRINVDLTATEKYVRLWQKGSRFYLTKENRDGEIIGYTQENISRQLYDLPDTIKKKYQFVVLNGLNQKLDDDHPHLFLDLDDVLKDTIKEDIKNIESWIRRSTISDAMGESKEFYELLKKVDTVNIPKMFKIDTIESDKSITPLSVDEKYSFEKVKELYPDEYNKIKDKVFADSNMKLLDVEKITKEYPIINSILFTYKTCKGYDYRHFYPEHIRRSVESMNEYCKTLKKEGK